MADTIMASVEKFRLAIPRIRDIFRRCGITGMDSMRHASLYLLSRFLTLERTSQMGFDSSLAWENMMLAADKSAELAMNHFENSLMPEFDKLFKTQKFTFEMGRNHTAHYEIMEILNDICMDDIDMHTDVLGFVYEDHLSSGAANARDLGQFFTDRSVCNYMVKLCNPKYKRPGVPESVCDPSMGTGGFLSAYMKSFESVDWDAQQKQIHGWDHDNKVAGFARLNLFMESGGSKFEHLHCEDSLKKGLTTSYDIILANMPFGLKGLKYADCHESVKLLGLNGTKSEPLFLQLMMVSLNQGGRCAVVIPDSALVNVSSCHNATRKFLIKNFNLKRVIKMTGKMFTNTAIKPSILFFERSGTTTQTEFWEIKKKDSEIIETHIATIPVEKFDDTHSLDMRRYIDIDTAYQYPVVSMKDIVEVTKNTKPLTLEKAVPGKFPLYSASIKIRTHDTSSFDGTPTIIQACVGSNLENCIHYSESPFAATGNLWVLRGKAGVNLKYVYYFLKSTHKILTKVNSSVLPKITITDFNAITIPLPPLKIQQTIVKELDAIQKEKDKAQKIIDSADEKAKQSLASFLEG